MADYVLVDYEKAKVAAQNIMDAMRDSGDPPELCYAACLVAASGMCLVKGASEEAFLSEARNIFQNVAKEKMLPL